MRYCCGRCRFPMRTVWSASQHISTRRRARRWKFDHELLRAAWTVERVRRSGRVSRRRRDRRRDRGDRARVHHAGLTGVLRHARHDPAARTCVHRRGNDLRNRERRRSCRTTIGRSTSVAIRSVSDVPSASTAVPSQSSACCRRRSASCRRGAESTCRWRRVADERGPDLRHSGNSAHMIARLAPAPLSPEPRRKSTPTTPSSKHTDPQAKIIADAGFRRSSSRCTRSHVAAIRPTLLLVQAGVLFLLVIGAVNVTNLLLIRATGRLKELAVRQALGAARRHIVAEVTMETTLLTLLGGTRRRLRSVPRASVCSSLLGSSRLPLGAQVGFDVRVGGGSRLPHRRDGAGMALPIAWYSLRSYSSSAPCTRRHAGRRPAAPRSGCAMRFSSRRSPCRSCCLQEPGCWPRA